MSIKKSSTQSSKKISSKKSNATSQSDVLARAERGKEEILQLQANIVPGPGLEPIVRKHMAIWTRVPLQALVQSLSLHEKYGAKVGDFDANGVREAVDYELGITPLLDVAKAFVRRLEDGVLQRRSAIGKQPLGLVMSLRAAVRYGSDPQVQRDLDQLEGLMIKKRKAKGASKTTGANQPSPSPPAVSVTSPSHVATATPSAAPSVSNGASNGAASTSSTNTPSVDVSIR